MKYTGHAGRSFIAGKERPISVARRDLLARDREPLSVPSVRAARVREIDA